MPRPSAFRGGAYRAILIGFFGGLVVLLLAAAVPLKHVRTASNLLILCGSLFIATQLGQQIAKVGNSDNTSEPHLRIQAQTVGTGVGVATMDIPTIIRSLHAFPVVLIDVVLTRRDTESRPANADVRRGDLVRPAG